MNAVYSAWGKRMTCLLLVLMFAVFIWIPNYTPNAKAFVFPLVLPLGVGLLEIAAAVGVTAAIVGGIALVMHAAKRAAGLQDWDETANAPKSISPVDVSGVAATSFAAFNELTAGVQQKIVDAAINLADYGDNEFELEADDLDNIAAGFAKVMPMTQQTNGLYRGEGLSFNKYIKETATHYNPSGNGGGVYAKVFGENFIFNITYYDSYLRKNTRTVQLYPYYIPGCNLVYVATENGYAGIQTWVESTDLNTITYDSFNVLYFFSLNGAYLIPPSTVSKSSIPRSKTKIAVPSLPTMPETDDDLAAPLTELNTLPLDQVATDAGTADPDNPPIPDDPTLPLIPDIPITADGVNWSLLTTGWSGIQLMFPFSLPWDLMNIFKSLKAPRQTPKIEIKLPKALYNQVLVIDLSIWDETAALIRSLILGLFTIGLILVSYKFVKL